MDFGGFYRFVVRKENCDKPNGARYFFDLFDVDGDGLIGPFDLTYFYRDLVRESTCALLALNTFIEETLDKTQASELGFTVDQFISCGAAREIVEVLSDYDVFRSFAGYND